MCIRGEESEIYQGKGRGGVLGKGKGTCIRGKEREVSVGQGRRLLSVVRREAKLTYLW